MRCKHDLFKNGKLHLARNAAQKVKTVFQTVWQCQASQETSCRIGRISEISILIMDSPSLD